MIKSSVQTKPTMSSTWTECPWSGHIQHIGKLDSSCKTPAVWDQCSLFHNYFCTHRLSTSNIPWQMMSTPSSERLEEDAMDQVIAIEAACYYLPELLQGHICRDSFGLRLMVWQLLLCPPARWLWPPCFAHKLRNSDLWHTRLTQTHTLPQSSHARSWDEWDPRHNHWQSCSTVQLFLCSKHAICNMTSDYVVGFSHNMFCIDPVASVAKKKKKCFFGWLWNKQITSSRSSRSSKNMSFFKGSQVPPEEVPERLAFCGKCTSIFTEALVFSTHFLSDKNDRSEVNAQICHVFFVASFGDVWLTCAFWFYLLWLEGQNCLITAAKGTASTACARCKTCFCRASSSEAWENGRPADRFRKASHGQAPIYTKQDG